DDRPATDLRHGGRFQRRSSHPSELGLEQFGEVDHLKVFANDAADAWFKENDPEGVAFEYEVLE
ncbi:MAG TPA: hypothetical protein VJ251_19455, partial [Stellaceae bacterium]|nr:hypothetical protein [Stellaceae bacterium]